jgi:hypothetical protein
VDNKPIPDEIKQRLSSVTNRRARIVIDHILEHGFITTEDLEKRYGYNHPPRAARDVREAGIPLETFRVQSSDGRSIAAYRFGDLSQVRQGKLQGRRAFSKQFKAMLYERSQGKCTVCSGYFESRYFQIDHRVPYEVAGDTNSDFDVADYMLLCGSCNRAKSWSCEHCPNWQHEKLSQVCRACYWGNPENYAHIALRDIRRTDILWSGSETQIHDQLKQIAEQENHSLPEYVKRIISRVIDNLP